MLPWLVLELTGRATAAGIVATAMAVPLAVSSVFSGTVVDLLGRRATSMASDLASALTIAGIPLLSLTGGLTVTPVAILAALGAVFDPAGVTARESMLPDAELRYLYDRDRFGLVLIGMPELDRTLSRYARFYSRIGFLHRYNPLDDTRVEGSVQAAE